MKQYSLIIKSNKLYLLEIYLKFLQNLSKIYNFSVVAKFLPKKIIKFSVYRSPHIFKKSKEHYQTCWYTYVIYIDNLTNINLLKLFLTNKPTEVICKIKYIG